MTEFINSHSVIADDLVNDLKPLPMLGEVNNATHYDLQKFRNELQQYFISGKKTKNSLEGKVVPVLISPHLNSDNLTSDFPVLFDPNMNFLGSLSEIIKNAFSENFSSKEISDNQTILWQIESFLLEQFSSDHSADLGDLLQEKIEPLLHENVEGQHCEAFIEQCLNIKDQLISKKAISIDFSADLPFHLLNLQLKEREEGNKAFIEKLQKSITGLKEIIRLQNSDANSTLTHFEFANELISFDKIADMATPAVSSAMPEERMMRLRRCLDTMKRGVEVYDENAVTVFVSKKLADEYSLKETLGAASLKTVSSRPNAAARKAYKEEIKEFVRIISAKRIADLEINQSYDEELHTPYFEGFNQSYLADQDIQHFRTLVVVDEARHLIQEPRDFLAHLTYGDFIKVVAVNRLNDFDKYNEHPEAEESYLELAALAIFRRNAFVFQGAGDEPELLNKALRKGLNARCPVLWNILLSDPNSQNQKIDYLTLKSAIESRYFPRLVYDIHMGESHGGHFDISINPQPDVTFPHAVREVTSSNSVEAKQYSLTIADFWAMNPDNASLLEVIPSDISTDELVTLAEYLVMDQNEIVGKVPFLWVVDEQNGLKRAIVPMYLVHACRARMDYWHFLQETSGVNSKLLSQNLTEAKSKWEVAKATEIDDLKSKLNTDFDRTRNEDLARAIERILNNLLDSDKEISTLLEETSLPNSSQDGISLSSEEKIKEAKETEEKIVIQSDVWIESDLCTSCSDCIDALPGVFKYNSDKLAVVHNTKGGSYAKIVATAEKCPARCIHPGLPHDESETGLEKMLKRAEKYN